MVSAAFGIFPTKFHKIVFVKCPCAFRLRRLAQNGCRGISVWHFPCKFPHKMALVKCPCACRLRRLAQKDGPGRRVRDFPCEFPYEMAPVRSPVEPSRHFGPVRSLWLWHGANFDIARAALSALWAGGPFI